jgi:hypothetical protein
MSFLKRRALVLVSILLCVFLFFQYFVLRTVPPICGQVVDAVTGEPIRDVSVALNISYYEAWAPHRELKGRATTNSLGWFLLPPAFHQVGFPLTMFGGYWLTVNQGLGVPILAEGSAATEVFVNPMFNARDSVVSNKKYFPLAVTFRREGCDGGWFATCAYKGFWWGISIPLIPVLEDVEDCKKIRYVPLRERCRQLNTYRAALSHADTYQDVQRGKALCAEVDHGAISAECLQELHLYMRGPSPTVSLPEGMFAAAIGQVPRFNQGCGMLDSFTGHFHCGANYGPKEYVFWVAVGVEEWPDPELAKGYFPEGKPQFADYKEATVRDELRSGGKIRLYRGPQYTAAYWVSKNRFVQVLFYHPIPEQEEFISHYLAEFPSTLR